MFWFSGTGNSEYVAERVHNALAAEGKSESVSIAEAMKNKAYSYHVDGNTLLGFVFPTYFWGVPSIVRDFISRLETDGKPESLYVVLTCWGSAGMSDVMTASLLEKRGLYLDAAFSVSMPDNYCILLDLMTPKEKIAPILNEAGRKIETVLSVLKNGCSGYDGRSLVDRGAAPRLKTALLYPLYDWSRTCAPFHADDTCIAFRSYKNGGAQAGMDRRQVRALPFLPAPLPRTRLAVRQEDAQESQICFSPGDDALIFACVASGGLFLAGSLPFRRSASSISHWIWPLMLLNSSAAHFSMASMVLPSMRRTKHFVLLSSFPKESDYYW